MKSTLVASAFLALTLTACSKEPAPPAAPPAPKAAAPAPAAAPAAPAGEMSQAEKEKMAKDLVDAAKSSAKKGE